MQETKSEPPTVTPPNPPINQPSSQPQTPPLIPPASLPLKSKPPLKRNIFIISTLIIFFLLGAFVLLNNRLETDSNGKTGLAPTPILLFPTVSGREWIKCTNYDLNIEFDCPALWTVPVDISTHSSGYIYKTTYNNSVDFILKFYYGLNRESHSVLSFEKYKEDHATQNPTPILIDNRSAFSYHDTEDNLIIALTHPTNNDDVTLILEIVFSSEFIKNNPESVNRILESFEFINLLDVEKWISYENNNLGVGFKYRPDLKIETGKSNDSLLLINNSESYHLLGYHTMFYTSISSIDLGGLDPKEYALKLCGDEPVNDYWKKIYDSCLYGLENSFEVYKNDNIDGFSFFYNPYENTSYVVIFPNKDKSKYFLLSSAVETGGGGPTEMGMKTINQILSTFEFLPDTSDWKTYTNPQNTFTFTYPADWEAKDTVVYGSSSETKFYYNQTATLTLIQRINYDQSTGLPYQSLKSYLISTYDSAQDIQVSQQKGKLINYPGGEHNVARKSAVFFTPDLKSIIEISYTPGYYLGAKSEDVLSQILSTFEFID